MVATKHNVLVYSNRTNAYVIPREQLGDAYGALAQLALAQLPGLPRAHERIEEMKETVIETFSPEETHALGKKIGQQAKPGDVYTLIGDLGVGKTVFTQGIAEGLGITEPICSPTFTIVQVYEGRAHAVLPF